MGEDNRRLLLLLAVCLHQAVMFTSGHDQGDHSTFDTGSVLRDEKSVTASRLNSSQPAKQETLEKKRLGPDDSTVYGDSNVKGKKTTQQSTQSSAPTVDQDNHTQSIGPTKSSQECINSSLGCQFFYPIHTKIYLVTVGPEFDTNFSRTDVATPPIVGCSLPALFKSYSNVNLTLFKESLILTTADAQAIDCENIYKVDGTWLTPKYVINGSITFSSHDKQFLTGGDNPNRKLFVQLRTPQLTVIQLHADAEDWMESISSSGDVLAGFFNERPISVKELAEGRVLHSRKEGGAVLVVDGLFEKFNNSGGQKRLTLSFQAVPWCMRVPLQVHSPTGNRTGYIQSSNWNSKVESYDADEDTCVTVWGRDGQDTIMVSFVSLDELPSASSCDCGVLEIYLQATCQGSFTSKICDPAKENAVAYKNQVMSVRFQGTGIPYTRFRLLYSFFDPSEPLKQVNNGKWVCTGSSGPVLVQHFMCGSTVMCEQEEDRLAGSCPPRDVCGLSSSLRIDDGSDPRCYRYVRSVRKITWAKAHMTCKQYRGHVVSLNTEEEWRRVADFWNINVTDNVQYLIVGLREHLTRRYSYVPVWQWHDQTVAYYLNVSWHNYLELSRPYCAVFRKGERHLTIVSCYTRIRASFLCEIPNNTQSGSQSSSRSPTNSLRYPASLSRPASALPHMMQCPNQEVTYTVLGCPCQGSLENEFKTRCLPENPLLKSTTHFCNNIWTVHVSFLCNHVAECPNGADETHCIFSPCQQNQFWCRDTNQCFPSNFRCDGKADCNDTSDETSCSNHSEFHGNTVLPPAIINLSVKGNIAVTPVNISQGDPVCPETHFQCPGNGYCLPVYVRCNDVRDCPGGEDEMDCASYRCPGFYRCRDSQVCVHADHVCDGVAQCCWKDDELLCNITCPSNCTCVGFAFVCGCRFSANLYTELRYVEADHTGMSLPDFANNNLLSVLRLRHCGITNIGVVTLPNLLELDLSYNLLTTFTGVEIEGMKNLRYLYLAFNELLFLNAIDYVNVRFPHLRTLDMSGGSTREVSNTSFRAFPVLRHLNLSRSQLQKVQEPGFSVLTELQILDLSKCPLTEIYKDIFKRLPQVQIYVSQYQLCCPSILPEGFNRDNCHTPFNEVSSCTALLRTDTFRVFLVIYAFFALVGNFLSFVYRVFGKGVDTTLGFDIFVTHLCVSDFLMGVYLAIVGIADRVYYGNYEWNNTRWKQSIACQAAGFLSFLSSEVSAFLICFITLERFLVTRFPLRRLRFSHKWAQAACVAGWVMGVLLAVVPFFPFSPPWDFYSQTGICIPLPITSKAFPGSDYSFFIMIVFNFVLFLVIAVGQLLIFKSVRSQSKAVSTIGRRSEDATIARRLLAVAMTDFLCWFPIGLLGLMARSGIPVSDSVSVAMAIFVLPLNSALNPFLYTFHVLPERRRVGRARQGQTSTNSETTTTTCPTCSARRQGEPAPDTVREQALKGTVRDMLSLIDSMVGKTLEKNLMPPDELQLRLTWMIKDRNSPNISVISQT